jgi:beta-glucosidase
MDPVFLGEYPADALRQFAKQMPDIKPDDMKTINQPLDFFGVNTYTGFVYTAADDGMPQQVPWPDGQPITAMGWQLLPETLYWGPKFFYERYGKPIIVTENGMANLDWISLDGKVHDPARIDLLTRYLRQLKRAADDSVDIRGYFHWSLTDNLEWAEGFSKRFGLAYIDYTNQKRILKDSAYWYKDMIAANGNNL